MVQEQNPFRCRPSLLHERRQGENSSFVHNLGRATPVRADRIWSSDRTTSTSTFATLHARLFVGIRRRRQSYRRVEGKAIGARAEHSWNEAATAGALERLALLTTRHRESCDQKGVRVHGGVYCKLAQYGQGGWKLVLSRCRLVLERSCTGPGPMSKESRLS